MRIALAHAHMFRFARGVERYIVALASAFARAGVEATIVTLRPPIAAPDLPAPVRYPDLDPRVRVHTLPDPRYYTAVTSIPFYLADFARRGGYDHILIHFGLNGEGLAARLVAALSGGRTRYSIVFHFPYEASPGRFREFRRYGLLGHATHRIAVSSYIAASLRDHLGASCTVIPSGVDARHFHLDPARRDTTRAALGIAPHERVLLSVGALEPRKGMDRLLAALAPEDGGAPPAPADRFVVVGDGTEAPSLRARAAALGLDDRVIWVARTVDMPALYNAADLFALLSNHEAFGLVALEAMACGLPVVVSDGSAFPEFVTPDVGLLVDPADGAAVRRALNLLLGDAALRARMGSAGRRRVEAAYTWDRVARDVLALVS